MRVRRRAAPQHARRDLDWTDGPAHSLRAAPPHTHLRSRVTTVLCMLRSLLCCRCHLQITREEGARRLYRGFTATVAGAIPSHAMHFATYEVRQTGQATTIVL